MTKSICDLCGKEICGDNDIDADGFVSISGSGDDASFYVEIQDFTGRDRCRECHIKTALQILIEEVEDGTE